MPEPNRETAQWRALLRRQRPAPTAKPRHWALPPVEYATVISTISIVIAVISFCGTYLYVKHSVLLITKPTGLDDDLDSNHQPKYELGREPIKAAAILLLAMSELRWGMDTLPVIEVKPVYGYGWLIGGERREVPAAFTMRLERSQPKSWDGIVLTQGHEFEGRRVTLTQRHLEWSGYVNIVMEADRPTTGSGQLEVLPSLQES